MVGAGSHGSQGNQVRPSKLLAGFVFIALFTGLVTSRLRPGRQERAETLAKVAERLSKKMNSRLDSLRHEAEVSLNANSSSANVTGGVFHVAEWRLERRPRSAAGISGSRYEVRSVIRSVVFPGFSVLNLDEELFLQSIAERLAVPVIQEGENQPSQWIQQVIRRPVSLGQGPSHPQGLVSFCFFELGPEPRLITVLVDPSVMLSEVLKEAASFQSSFQASWRASGQVSGASAEDRVLDHARDSREMITTPWPDPILGEKNVLVLEKRQESPVFSLEKGLSGIVLVAVLAFPTLVLIRLRRNRRKEPTAHESEPAAHESEPTAHEYQSHEELELPEFNKLPKVLNASEDASEESSVGEALLLEKLGSLNLDRSLLFRQLTWVVSDLSGKPVLFFQYQPQIQSFILQSQKGLPSQREFGAVTFPLSSRAARTDTGASDSLPGLQDWLGTTFPGVAYRTWRVPALAPSDELDAPLGLLVILGQENSEILLQKIDKMVQMTGYMYEKTHARV